MKNLFLMTVLAFSFSALASNEACQIDVFVRMPNPVFSSWVKAERSNLNAIECLEKAYDLAERADQLNIRLNDRHLALAGNLTIRK